jgi:hypothetical protein
MTEPFPYESPKDPAAPLLPREGAWPFPNLSTFLGAFGRTHPLFRLGGLLALVRPVG